MDDIRKEIVIEASIEKVWQALCTSEGLAAWLMPNDFKPEVGAKFQFQSGEDCNNPSFLVDCMVTEIDPPHRLAFTWKPVPDAPDTLVTFELRDLGGKTEVVLTHTGWADTDLREMHNGGWVKKLAALKEYLGG